MVTPEASLDCSSTKVVIRLVYFALLGLELSGDDCWKDGEAEEKGFII